MKQRWTLLLLGPVLFILLSSMKTIIPTPDPVELKVNVSALDDQRVQLTAQNETGKKMYITVYKQEPNAFYSITETEIFTEQVPGEVAKYIRTLNLSKLETGVYRICVRAGKKRFERSLDIKSKPALELANTRVVLIQ